MIEINRNDCTGCGTCVENCPMTCITMDKFNKAVVNNDECIDCMMCASECIPGAIGEL